MPSDKIHTVVDWSYTQDPVGYLRELRGKGGWFDEIVSMRDEFMQLSYVYNEFSPQTNEVYYKYGIDFAAALTFGHAISKQTNKEIEAFASLVYYYSLHDVLNPILGNITYLPKPERNYHILSPIRPVMAIQGEGLLKFIQWDNLIVTNATGYDIESLVRSRNYGRSTIDTTGQLDLLSPPGYDTSLTSSGVYITSWEEISVNDEKGYKLRWSDGTETITQSNPITSEAKNSAYTIQETVKSVNVSYEEDGLKNKSTTDIFLQVSATPDNCRASSTISGGNPAEAFKGDVGSGWLSADGDTTDVWLAYDFGSSGAVINKWRFMGHKTVPNCGPKRFRIEATNSATLENWDILYSNYENQIYKPLGLGEWSDWFTFSNGISYRFYRLYIIESYAT